MGNIGKEPVIMNRRGTRNIVGTNGRGKPVNFELKDSLISETLVNKNLIAARRIADAGHTIVIGRGAGGGKQNEDYSWKRQDLGRRGDFRLYARQ